MRIFSVSFSCAKSPEYQKNLQTLIGQLSHNFIINILLHGGMWDNIILQGIAENISKIIYENCYPESFSLIKFLLDSKDTLSNTMIKCTENYVRQFMLTITHKAANCVIKYEKILPESLSAKFIDFLIENIIIEISQNNSNPMKFADLLLKVLLDNKQFINPYLFDKDFITTTLDLYLGKESPLFKEKNKNLSIVPTASNNNNQNLNNISEYNSLIEIIAQMLDYYFDNLSSGKIKKISDNAWKCLRISKILEKLVQFSCKSESTFKYTLLRLMKNDKKYTKAICKSLLSIIHDYNPAKMLQIKDFLVQVILYEDTLQRNRLEFLLGIAQPVDSKWDKTAYGLCMASDLASQVIQFVSPIQNADNKNTPLLEQLYKYSNRFGYEKLTIILSCDILKELSENDILNEFLRNMHSPTYSYTNYLNWLTNSVQECLTELTKKDINWNKDLKLGYEPQNIINDWKDIAHLVTEIRPYVVGKYKEQKEFFSQKFAEQNIRIVAQEIYTEIYTTAIENKPNSVISNDYFVTHFGKAVPSIFGQNYNNFNAKLPEKPKGLLDKQKEEIELEIWKTNSDLADLHDETHIWDEKEKLEEKLQKINEKIENPEKNESPIKSAIAENLDPPKSKIQEIIKEEEKVKNKFMHGCAIMRFEIVNCIFFSFNKTKSGLF